ncbi:MAG: hypothetical protein VW491_10180 [Gammaproteobacteria bacterium]
MNPLAASSDSLPDRALKPIWVAVAIGGMALIGISWWTPNVDPIMPGSGVLSEEGDLTTGLPATNPSTSFVDRPLFMTSRRPVNEVDVGTAIEEQTAESIAVEQITGATLLGVFASGDVSGVIVAEKGTRRRIVEGEQLQGWELMSVEPRGAVFTDGGRMARLDMQTLSNAAASLAERNVRQNEAGGDSRSNTDEGVSQEVKPTVVPSFETMYQSKARSAQASANTEVAESASSQEGGTKDE